MTTLDVDAQLRAAVGRILELVLREGQPVVLVDSPPGAGKTRLVLDAAAIAVVHLELRVGIVAPNGAQTHAIIRRLLNDFPQIPLQLLQSDQNVLPPDLEQRRDMLPPVSKPADLVGGSGVVVGTAHKFLASDFPVDTFDLLICDEAYQLSYHDFAPLFHVARRRLLVGDPGQLPPLVLSSIDQFEVAPYRVHWATPREVLRRFPDAPVVSLPISRRLPRDTVELIQPSFYPQLQFQSAASDEERRLTLAPEAAPRGTENMLRMSERVLQAPVDRAIDILASGRSIVSVLLPALNIPSEVVDTELAGLIAYIVDRLLQRGASWAAEGRVLSAQDIGCIDAHVASGEETRRFLRQRDISPQIARVDTPETWQGLERPLMVVKHPLSGMARLTAFGLEPGRWCVMLSRHQLGCIIVGREGIDQALERHTHDCATRPIGGDDMEWGGWRAHSTLWSELERRGQIVRVREA